ncbi:hypothetical protein TKK_0002096 [Trichogramma kaykai]
MSYTGDNKQQDASTSRHPNLRSSTVNARKSLFKTNFRKNTRNASRNAGHGPTGAVQQPPETTANTSGLQANRNCDDYERRRRGTDTESTRKIKWNCYEHYIMNSKNNNSCVTAVTEAQIRARRRLRATKEKFAKEEQQKIKLKQEYTNQWIARSFGTIARKLPEDKFKRPQFPTCRIPVDEVLQIHVERWDQLL